MSIRSLPSRLHPVAWLLVLLWAGWLGYQAVRLPRLDAAVPAANRVLQAPAANKAVPAETWNVFQDTSRASRIPPAASSTGRYRLAGTFTSFTGDGDGQEVRKAIIDDAGARTQVLVQETDELGAYTVEKIRRESVLLRNRTGESLELTLSFSTAPAPASKGPSILKPTTFDDMPSLETSRFGKRIADNRWVLNRESLMAYYQELLDEPARMASLFASLEDYNEDGELNGFQVNIVGEKELFDAMGLKEGDIIREVNSIRMVSSRRSEYLVKEFIQGRLNAVVFDVERAGERQKLIELIR